MWHPAFQPQSGKDRPQSNGRLRMWSERIKLEFFGPHVVRCSVCHAELAPDEFGDGMCRDQAACCLRRYSQRCF